MLERLLYRLSVSSQRDRFALKGAMLFAVRTTDSIRLVRGLDLPGFGDSGVDALRDAFRDIMGTPVADDEMVLEAALNGEAEAIVTHNVRDFRPALKLGLSVATPGEIVRRLNL